MITIKFDGQSLQTLAQLIANAVENHGPYVKIEVTDKEVIVDNKNFRICSDDD